MQQNPYVFVKDAGSWHIKSRSKPNACIGCVRADAASILWVAAYSEGWAAALVQAREAVEQAVVK